MFRSPVLSSSRDKSEITLCMMFAAGFMSSGNDHIQAGDHGCTYLGLGRTAPRLHHCGTPRSRMLDWQSEQLVILYLAWCQSVQKFRALTSQKSRANAAWFVPVRAGGEGAVLGVPSAVLCMDRWVVRHDRGADPGDGAADGHAAEEGQRLISPSSSAVFVAHKSDVPSSGASEHCRILTE